MTGRGCGLVFGFRAFLDGRKLGELVGSLPTGFDGREFGFDLLVRLVDEAREVVEELE